VGVCHGGQTVNVGCCIYYTVGRDWSRDWLKEMKSEKGMEEFIVAEKTHSTPYNVSCKHRLMVKNSSF